MSTLFAQNFDKNTYDFLFRIYWLTELLNKQWKTIDMFVNQSSHEDLSLLMKLSVMPRQTRIAITNVDKSSSECDAA